MNHREKEKLFKTLFDAYYERLYYAAATILGDQMVAEDIIEDVFEHYWERINDDAITNSPSYAYFVTTQVGLSYSPMHNVPRCNQRE